MTLQAQSTFSHRLFWGETPVISQTVKRETVTPSPTLRLRTPLLPPPVGHEHPQALADGLQCSRAPHRFAGPLSSAESTRFTDSSGSRLRAATCVLRARDALEGRATPSSPDAATPVPCSQSPSRVRLTHRGMARALGTGTSSRPSPHRVLGHASSTLGRRGRGQTCSLQKLWQNCHVHSICHGHASATLAHLLRPCVPSAGDTAGTRSHWLRLYHTCSVA